MITCVLWKIRACKHLAGSHEKKKESGRQIVLHKVRSFRKNFIWLFIVQAGKHHFAGHTISPKTPFHSKQWVFIHHCIIYLRDERAEALWFNYLAAVPTLPVAVPLIRSGLPTSGSDEANWKHVLHASSPDRWDNIVLLMTERERRRERDVGRKILPPQRDLLVLNSSTLSCRRFWGSYCRKAARLCLHME